MAVTSTMWLQFAGYWIIYLIIVFGMFKGWITWYWGVLFIPALTCLVYGAPVVGAGSIAELMVRGPAMGLTSMPLYIWGCIFSRVLIDTGVVEALVKKSIELGGERVIITCFLITAVWVYVSFGTGPAGVILVGTITLPVMMAMGVTPLSASLIHGCGWAMGYCMWPIYWPGRAFSSGATPIQDPELAYAWYMEHMNFQWLLLASSLVVGFIFIYWRLRRDGFRLRWSPPSDTAEPIHAWEREVPPPKSVPAYCYIIPGLPWLMIVGLGIPGVVSFMVGIALGYLMTHPASGRSIRDLPWMMEKSFFEGSVMIAGLMLVGTTVRWITYLTFIPNFMNNFQQVILTFAPRNAMMYIIFFGIIIWSAVYRGPGSTLGTPMYRAFSVAAIAGDLGPIQHPAIWAAFVSMMIYYLWADPTIIYTVWTCSVTGASPVDFPLTIAPWGWIMSVCGLFIGAAMYIG
jgi:hypothetical protein